MKEGIVIQKAVSEALPVRFEFILSLGDPNDKQKETISKLVDAGLVLDKVVIENDILEGAIDDLLDKN